MNIEVVRIATYNGVVDDVLQCTGGGACGFYCQPFGDVKTVTVSVWAKVDVVGFYNFIIFGEEFSEQLSTEWQRLIFKVNKNGNTPIFQEDEIHIKIEKYGSGSLYLYKMMVEADADVYSDWKMAPEDELMYERRKSGTVIQFNDALAGSNLQDLVLYGTAGKVIQDAVYVYIKYEDSGEVVRKKLPLSLAEWNLDFETGERTQEFYDIKLFELDGIYDEFSFKEGMYTHRLEEITSAEDISSMEEDDDISSLRILDPIEVEYLNKDDGDTELEMDQLRTYIQSWSNILLEEERGELCCSLEDYDITSYDFEFPSSIDTLYITAAWLRKDISSVEAYSKGLKARNEEQISRNKLDKVIEIDRDEGTIQIGTDTREHLVINNNSVTISQGEEMESRFTGRHFQLGPFRLQLINNGLAFNYMGG